MKNHFPEDPITYKMQELMNKFKTYQHRAYPLYTTYPDGLLSYLKYQLIAKNISPNRFKLFHIEDAY